MSGTELAYRLAEIRPGVPVLYMSGYTDDVVVRAGVRDGSVPLVEKPFSAQTLSRAVRHALERGSDAAALAA